MDIELSEWIEKFYSDFEKGMAQCGKNYTRPSNYIERALRILSGGRNTLKNQYEGKKGVYHEDI